MKRRDSLTNGQMVGNAIERGRDSISAQKHRPSGAVLDRPHPLHRRPALRNSSSGAAHLANSDSARAGSGTGAKDKRGLIGSAQRQMADAPGDLWKRSTILLQRAAKSGGLWQGDLRRGTIRGEASFRDPVALAQDGEFWPSPENSGAGRGILAQSREFRSRPGNSSA
jgi:hypothetical protein